MNIVLLLCPKVGKREYDVAALKQKILYGTEILIARDFYGRGNNEK